MAPVVVRRRRLPSRAPQRVREPGRGPVGHDVPRRRTRAGTRSGDRGGAGGRDERAAGPPGAGHRRAPGLGHLRRPRLRTRRPVPSPLLDDLDVPRRDTRRHAPRIGHQPGRPLRGGPRCCSSPTVRARFATSTIDRREIGTRLHHDGRLNADEHLADWFRVQGRTGRPSVRLCASAGLYGNISADPPYPYLWLDGVDRIPGAHTLLARLLEGPDAEVRRRFPVDQPVRPLRPGRSRPRHSIPRCNRRRRDPGLRAGRGRFLDPGCRSLGSPHARGLHRRSRSHSRRSPRRRPVAGPPRRPRRARHPGADRAVGHRPERRRRRRVRQRRLGRPAGRVHRPHVLARRRPAPARARHHDRPPVRLGPAGRALRRPGGDVGDDGPRRRRRRAEHVDDPDLLGDDPRRPARVRRSLHRLDRAGPPATATAR